MKNKICLEKLRCMRFLQSPLVLACVINLLFVIKAYAEYIPYNETNDDTGMAALVSGAYGGGETHLVFINVIFTLFMRLFYIINSSINWYSLFQFIITFISFTVIGYVLIERIGKKIGVIIFILLMAAFHTDFYLLYQFTRVSTICGIAGYLLIFHSIEKEKYLKGTILGGGMVLLGFLVRYSSSMSILPFAGMLGIVYTLGNRKYWPLQKNLKKLSRYFLTFGLLFSSIIICVLADRAFYYSDPEWKEYYEYNKIRAQILDYGWPEPWPSYSEHAEEYEKLGISENDSVLYSSGVLSDVENLPMEKLEQILEFKQNQNNFEFNIIEFLYYSYNYFINNVYIWFILIAIILYLLLFKYKTRYTILVMINCAVFAGIFAYYYYQNRIVPRAFVSTVFVTVCIILFCYDKENLLVKKFDARQTLLLGSASIFFSLVYVSPHYLELQDSRLNVDKLYDVLATDKESVYVAGRDVFRWNYRYFDAYKVIPEDFYSNQINIGGWLSRTPTMNKQMEKFGVENLYTDLVEKDNMYFYTDSYADILCTYINEHYYDDQVSYSIVSKADWVKIVKYTRNFEDISSETIGSCSVSSISNDENHAGYLDILITDIKDIKSDSDIYLEITDTETGKKQTYRAAELLEEGLGDDSRTVIIPAADFSDVSKCTLNVIVDDSGAKHYVETNNTLIAN